MFYGLYGLSYTRNGMINIRKIVKRFPTISKEGGSENACLGPVGMRDMHICLKCVILILATKMVRLTCLNSKQLFSPC